MLKALAKFFGYLCPGGRRKKAGKHEQKPVRPPLTPEEAYKRRESRRKRKAQKSARRRNRK
jgi:hypothetical protein